MPMRIQEGSRRDTVDLLVTWNSYPTYCEIFTMGTHDSIIINVKVLIPYGEGIEKP